MNAKDLKALHAGDEAALIQSVGGMSAEDLDALIAFEAGAARETVGNAIAARKATLGDQFAAKAETASTEPVPAWQSPDYAGPLDINKAEWRHRNIKPVAGAAHTKGKAPR